MWCKDTANEVLTDVFSYGFLDFFFQSVKRRYVIATLVLEGEELKYNFSCEVYDWHSETEK